jgi:hypothetical protein
VDRESFEAQIGAWAAGLLGEPPDTQGGEDAIAIDGKTMRGSQKQGAAGAHRLSVLAHRVGLTLAQQEVDDQTNESPVAVDLLRHLVLEGRIVTMDALLTQCQTAPHSVDAGGDYIIVVQENWPPVLGRHSDRVCPCPQVGERRTVAETLDLGHGRIEQRRRQTSAVLVG